MLLDQLSRLEVAAPLVIVVVGLSRVYFGSVLFSPRFAKLWNVIRRIMVPLIEKVVYARISTSPSLTNEAKPPEAVAVTPLNPTELAVSLDSVRSVEIPLLAGYKTDWRGEKESGTMVWYYGSTPTIPIPRFVRSYFDAPPTLPLPGWLQPYQVHLTTFPVHDEDGLHHLVTAHREANPYRPDKWFDHLFAGGSHSDSDGVRRASNALSEADVPLDDARAEALSEVSDE